jgi:hypothetical protein
MEVALRRRLEGVASISISQQHQTAEVVFAPGPHGFSAREFRAAVAEAGVEVVRFEIEACGRVEEDSGTRWFVAGPHRFVLSDGPMNHTPCLVGTLDDGREPVALVELARRAAPGFDRH